MSKIKLNLGSGDRKIHGFINVDSRKEVDPDEIGSINNIEWMGYNRDSVDLIYACHALEHFKRPLDVLYNWYIFLKPGGILRLSVPDFEAVVDYYFCNTDDPQVLNTLHGLIYGGHKYDLDVHYHCWDYKKLEKDLLDVGFKSVSKYDRGKTSHFYVDDYSAAYLPHMDKIHGQLMSLNVEAIK